MLPAEEKSVREAQELLWLAVRRGGADLTTPANVLMLTGRGKGGGELVDVQELEVLQVSKSCKLVREVSWRYFDDWGVM